MSAINIPIQSKGTETPGRVPLPTELLERQLFVQLADGGIYSKTSSGTIVKLGVSATDLALVATTGSYNDLDDKPTIVTYVLPPAQAGVLGGVMIGSGLNVDANGLVTAAVTSVRGQDGSAQTGAVVLTRSDLGLDILDGNNKIRPEYLPDSITGAMVYRGTWNASTNTPTIPAASSTNLGWLYVVSVAGTTDIDGNATWNVSDWLVSDGTVWQRVPAVVANVVSVNEMTGAVEINAANLPGLSVVGRTNLYSDLDGIPADFTPKPHTQSVDTITDIAQVAKDNDYNSLDNLPPDPAISLVGFCAIGSPVLQQNVRYPFARQVRFASNWAGSTAFFELYTGTTATVALNRIRGGVSTAIGSVQYSSSTGVVTFSATETDPTFLAGDQLEWVWPSNIAQFTTNMLGTRFA